MPFANYKFPEGILDHARKEEIIHRTTEMFIEYFGEGSVRSLWSWSKRLQTAAGARR
ncbi:hypothetical protein THH46_12545 [Pseudomonas sp. NA13]